MNPNYPSSRRELRESSSRRAQPLLKQQHDSLARIMGITSAGFVLPGLNFLLAGKKKTGFFLLTLSVIVVIGVIALYYNFNLEEITSSSITLFSNQTYSLVLLCSLGFLSLIFFFNVFLGYRSSIRGVMSKPKRAIAFTFALLLSLLAATPSAYAGYYTYLIRTTLDQVFVDETSVSSVEEQDSQESSTGTEENPWGEDEHVNILLLGSDAGPDRTGTRPDVIMVASINVIDGKTSLFTLPRNLQKVPFAPGTPGAKEFPQGFKGEDELLNSIWSWGEKNASLFPGQAQPGLRATQDAVAGVLGVEIDYYASVDMEGFSEGVDALGGVQVNVPRDLPIGKTGVPTNSYVKAGQDRLLNGYEALWYVRSRADSSDYDRMLRSRCMVSSLTQSISPTNLGLKFPEFSKILRDHMITNIPQEELIQWAELVTKIEPSKIQSLPFTADVIHPQNPDYEQIRLQVQQVLNTQNNVAPDESAPKSTPTLPTPAPNPLDEETPSSEGVQTVSSVC